jgi:hypothetical protein
MKAFARSSSAPARGADAKPRTRNPECVSKTKTPSAFGPQYALDDAFKRRARLHQSRFRVEQLRTSEFREYGNRLGTADALAGRNFYTTWPGMLDAVTARFPLGDKKIYFDMLASDHIPFNFFVPLREHPATISLVRDWTTVDVAKITAIDFEFAPAPKGDFLDDNTSFDAYITYQAHDDSRGAIGIEVKFTEGEYPWGRTEYVRMRDTTSKYHSVHHTSHLYTPDSLQHLPEPLLKQLWRNQLLGEAMKQHPKRTLAHFTSVLLYPAGNVHYAQAACEYQALLLPTKAQSAFRALTYETFISQCRASATSPQQLAWTEYLTRRYIVE